ncbi:Kidney mitochondrial carrier protein 1 [Trichoplax sp. H2]|nr:Kidney mitochondrial carrier protein 1 [Trichoplax sp. H2]|eukprot:RDD47652.1 Kidney mitochondrial carrier protein 1 [Trichoplax sp. H2]
MQWQPFILGGVASLAAESCTFPIDTAKIRLQIQGQIGDASLARLRYRGMGHALRLIAADEGFKALYSGLAPALLRQASYGTIKFGTYHTVKRIVAKNPEDETILTNVFAGMIAGALSSSIANPTDVLKVRMQAGSRMNLTGKNVLRSFADIYKEEGIRGLYRGVGPTSQRAAVIVAVQMPTYELSKRELIKSQLMNDGLSTHLCCSMISGLSMALVSNPLDVIKTRMVNQSASRIVSKRSASFYKNSFHCLYQTIRGEGILALYKGFVPSFLRVGPWNVIVSSHR